MHGPATEQRDVAFTIESSTARAASVVLTSAGPIVLSYGAPPLRIAGRVLDAAGDAVIVAVDWQGALRWAHQLRSDAHVIIDGLTVLPDGGVAFVGSFEHSLAIGDREVEGGELRKCYVARIDDAGSVLGLHAFGGSQETLCRGIAVVEDDAWIVASFSGTLRLGAQEHTSKGILDVVVAHMQLASGIVDGGFTFGTRAEDVGREVIVVGDDLIVAGTYASPWTASSDTGLAPTERTLVLSSNVALEWLGDGDGFITRFDRTGQPRWASRQAGPGFDVVKQIAPLRDGFAASVASQPIAPPPGVAGMASDVPLGGWVVHFDADGVERWRWTDPAMISPSAIVTTDRGVAFSGHYRDGLVAGDERWSARGTSDAMWIELDASGRVVGGDHCGSNEADFSDAIAVDREQRIWWGGGSAADSTCTGAIAGGFLRRAP